jgi:hypothetical protein
MSDLKQFTGRRTSPQEHLIRALTSGTAKTDGFNADGTPRIFWMPGFVPLEYLRASNRDRLGVTEADPAFFGTGTPAQGGQA